MGTVAAVSLVTFVLLTLYLLAKAADGAAYDDGRPDWEKRNRWNRWYEND